GTIPHHVEKDAAAELFHRSSLSKVRGEIAAPVKSIGFGKVFIRFLAIEEHQLGLCGKVRTPGQHSRHFQEQAGARTAVVRADEANVIERLGVVMRTQKS